MGGIVSLHSLRPNRHHLLPFLCKFVFDLAVSVANPYKSKSIDVDIVVINEDARSPGVHEFPFAIVDKDGRVGTPQHEDQPLAVSSYRCSIGAFSRVVRERRTKFREVIFELRSLSGGNDKNGQNGQYCKEGYLHRTSVMSGAN